MTPPERGNLPRISQVILGALGRPKKPTKARAASKTEVAAEVRRTISVLENVGNISRRIQGTTSYSFMWLVHLANSFQESIALVSWRDRPRLIFQLPRNLGAPQGRGRACPRPAAAGSKVEPHILGGCS